MRRDLLGAACSDTWAGARRMSPVDSTSHVTSPLEGFQTQGAGSDVSPEPETFDHDRLVLLVDTLERDIALIEGAMVNVEAREFASANAALDVLDGVSTA